MSFTRRYLLWLLLPPLAISLPPSILFLTEVIRFSAGTAGILALLLALTYAGGSVVFTLAVGPAARAVESALEGSGDLSRAMSRCLDRTRVVSLLLWGPGGILFATVASLALMRSWLGFAWFLVAAMISAFVSIVWGYGMGKHRLLAAAGDRPVRYIGKELPLGTKIAFVFIGSLTISSAALILLISSRVSTTLETLVVTMGSERFERVYENANLLAKVDAEALGTLAIYLPSGHALHLIDGKGSVTSTSGALQPAEIAAIRRIRNGDSLAFTGPDVGLFRPLKDGSILVMTVPWESYSSIPLQIALYTLVVGLITTGVFSAATIILSRDVTRPLHELREMARQMAGGNFEIAPRIFADDEVGHLNGSFAETRANLSQLLGRLGGSGTTITDGVRFISSGTEMLLVRSRNQSELTESSSAAVESLRGGIGRVLGAADTVAELTADASARSLEMQASSEEVARSMDHLFQSVEKTSSSTTEMNASMSEMSRRTDVLAGIGEEVLSFVAEMDSTASELLTSAEATANIAQSVRESAAAGGDAVGRTVEGIAATQELTTSTARTIDDLQRSVGEITQILAVIEDVANRTNLLSLNAAIIAAQAGEHGAGFTVVADEIRGLAERTRGSTKEIAGIIKAVQSGSRQAVQKMHEGVARVSGNVELAREAAAALEAIVANAGRSFEMATKISRALGEQSTASGRLHEVTSRMSDHIAEINKATREQARGTALLAHEAELVRDIAGQVKRATQEQSKAGAGITAGLEKIAEDARAMRDLLEAQLRETDRIADASREMLEIAQQNDTMARDLGSTVQDLSRSGQQFEGEVARFKFRA
jgi:methyl-accepting chemotaxis protein